MNQSEVIKVDTIEVHAAGEPGRVILNAERFVRGETMSERIAYCQDHLDGLRRMIIREPRGYPAMCGVFILPPTSEDSDFGIIVLEQGGFTPMSGSNTICAVTAAIEFGLVPIVEPVTTVKIDTAVGQIVVQAQVRNGVAVRLTIENVPSFVVGLDIPIEVKGHGTVPVDIVFGGQFYAQVSADQLGLEISPQRALELVRAGSLIKLAANEQLTIAHPLHPELDHVNLVMIHSGEHRPGKQARNAVVVPPQGLNTNDPSTWRGAVDRSPCGTGTSGRMVALHERGELMLGQDFIHQGILGTEFIGRLTEKTRIGEIDAYLPTIQGRGWVMGRSELMLRSDDPFPEGYMVGDIW